MDGVVEDVRDAREGGVEKSSLGCCRWRFHSYPRIHEKLETPGPPQLHSGPLAPGQGKGPTV